MCCLFAVSCPRRVDPCHRSSIDGADMTWKCAPPRASLRERVFASPLPPHATIPCTKGISFSLILPSQNHLYGLHTQRRGFRERRRSIDMALSGPLEPFCMMDQLASRLFRVSAASKSNLAWTLPRVCIETPSEMPIRELKPSSHATWSLMPSLASFRLCTSTARMQGART
jgi:hypothetical protein